MIQVSGVEGRVVDTPVSIMDLGPTLCGLAGAPQLPLSDGVDQSSAVLGGPATARPVVSEFFDQGAGDDVIVGRMVRDGSYKFITYTGLEEEDLLFHMEDDPAESVNCIGQYPQVARRLREAAKAAGTEDSAKRKQIAEKKQQSAFLSQWGRRFTWKNEGMFVPPEAVRYIDEKYKRPQYKK